ncbi:MAG: Lrp/AsnC family transcriptional regulator [candidate division NC10 bacterium]|nr:Lrp/AsnC family transcriptional regulator [candidate division NC10 bacterium]
MQAWTRGRESPERGFHITEDIWQQNGPGPQGRRALVFHHPSGEERAMAMAIMLINADPGKDRKAAQALKKIKGVSEIYLVSGLYDVVATIRRSSSEEILATVYDKVRGLSGVRSSHTMFCLEA